MQCVGEIESLESLNKQQQKKILIWLYDYLIIIIINIFDIKFQLKHIKKVFSFSIFSFFVRSSSSFLFIIFGVWWYLEHYHHHQDLDAFNLFKITVLLSIVIIFLPFTLLFLLFFFLCCYLLKIVDHHYAPSSIFFNIFIMLDKLLKVFNVRLEAYTFQ